MEKISKIITFVYIISMAWCVINLTLLFAHIFMPENVADSFICTLLGTNAFINFIFAAATAFSADLIDHQIKK